MKRLIGLVISCFLIACGGGTSGTSSTGGFADRTFVGQLRDQNGAPLANATVKIEATGDSTRTDNNGAFSFLASVPIGQNNLIVTAQDGSLYLITATVTEDQETVSLREVYPEIDIMRYGKWQIIARVTGEGCRGHYFGSVPVPADRAEADNSQRRIDQFAADNGYTGAILEQRNEIKDGTDCFIDVQILKDNNPVPNLAFTASTNTCTITESGQDNPNPLHPLAVGASDANGFIRVPFTSVAKGVCTYEVNIAGYGGLKIGAAVELVTFYPSELY